MFGERKQVRVGRVGNVTLQSAGGETDLKRVVRRPCVQWSNWWRSHLFWVLKQVWSSSITPLYARPDDQRAPPFVWFRRATGWPVQFHTDTVGSEVWLGPGPRVRGRRSLGVPPTTFDYPMPATTVIKWMGHLKWNRQHTFDHQIIVTSFILFLLSYLIFWFMFNYSSYLIF
jgi:hypothetical protein